MRIKSRKKEIQSRLSDAIKAFICIGVCFALAFLALTITSCQQQPAQSTINAQGTSELMYKPDEATVFAGVSVLNSTAQDAQAQADRITSAIIAGLKQIGIQEADIGTQQFTLYEDISYTQNGTKSNGWRATQAISVKTLDLAKIGPIVDACIGNGANQVQSINFELSSAKENEYKQLALAEASKNAQAKAESIAKSLNVKLGKIKTASENNAVYAPVTYALKDATGSGAAREAAAVLPPDLTVSAIVNLEYYIG